MSDCGCGKDVSLLLDEAGDGDAAIQALDAALTQVLEEEPQDLSIALIEDALAEEDLPIEPELSDEASLSTILAILERYPGLKITLSY